MANETPDVFEMATKGKIIVWGNEKVYLEKLRKGQFYCVESVLPDGRIKSKAPGKIVDNPEYMPKIQGGIYTSAVHGTSNNYWLVEGSDQFNRIISSLFNSMADFLPRLIASGKYVIDKDGKVRQKEVVKQGESA